MSNFGPILVTLKLSHNTYENVGSFSSPERAQEAVNILLQTLYEEDHISFKPEEVSCDLVMKNSFGGKIMESEVNLPSGCKITFERHPLDVVLSLSQKKQPFQNHDSNSLSI